MSEQNARHFTSEVESFGSVAFPAFGGVRIMMMPFRLEDVDGSLPDFLAAWRPAIAEMCEYATNDYGVAYLTIDEAVVNAGETHRRPGIHVDGMGSWGGGGGWGAPPNYDPPKPIKPAKPSKPKPTPRPKPGKGGMLLASSHVGCRAWAQEFTGWPDNDGGCAHLIAQCDSRREIVMQPNTIYWCGHFGVHEPLPMAEKTSRQVVRVSMPSACPWFDGYTVNPSGVLPDGPILPKRVEQMAYRQ